MRSEELMPQEGAIRMARGIEKEKADISSAELDIQSRH